MHKLLFTTILLLTFSFVIAQNENDESETVRLEMDEDARPTIELNPGSVEKKKKEEKKKKRKKNVFWDIKTKRKTIKTRKGNNITFQKFYILRNYEEPDPYVYSKFFYDPKEKEIIRKRDASKEYGMPLHGLFERIVNGEVVERGYFYQGMRHGRWERYKSGKNGLLVDKKFFNKGFPKESIITSYPQDTRLLKEVIPMHHGKKEGMYLSFFENGNSKEIGEYVNDIKVGTWYEYYDLELTNGKQRPKQQIRHRKKSKWHEDSIEPEVIRAWKENGEQTIKQSGKN